MRISQLFAMATCVTSVLACAKHDNHYSLKNKKRHIDPRADPGSKDWAYEASYNWGRINPGRNIFFRFNCQLANGLQITISAKQELSNRPSQLR